MTNIMNNIKFRAYVHELDEVCEVDEISYNEDGKFDIGIDGYADLFTSDECDIEQFIGLLDKNGKEIYEGDIIQTNKSKYKRFDKDGIYEVYFNKFLCHYALIASRYEWNHKHEQYDNYELTGAKTKDFEVIGNIHKNKELMKGLC